ncbi:hypothetical protein PYW08_002483 [Mythimna loreyi]|uniref:Uncharacterized protein n=1 Tax=Mythimna loreyi TaxID=667449 RepID=A0ACC2QM18_9NEOP|nr:hypothetical protein PYW08_002483 [Mythimna loreyi]
MAQKALETCVRDMQKMLSILAEKVTALECKIDDQSAIIVKQTGLINELISASEGKPPNCASTSAQAHQAVQRPLRQARLNKISNTATRPSKAAGQGTAVLKSSSASKAKLSNEDTPKSPEPNRVDVDILTNHGSPIDDLPSLVINGGEAMKPKVTAITAAGSNQVFDKRSGNTENEDQWKIVNRRRKSRKVVTGTGKTDDELLTVERTRYIQAWSFRPETTEQSVLNYLNKIQQCEEYYVEKRDIKSDKHAVFVIGFPESLYERFSSPTAWHPRVKVSDWFRVRPRGERGSGNKTGV